VGARQARRLRHVAPAAVSAIGLAAVLTACTASSSGAAPGPSASTSAPTTTAPTSSAATSPSPATTGSPTVVPTAPVSTAPAVPIGTPATVGGVTVRIGAVSSFTGSAVTPGELGGPAVAVPVTLRNDTSAAVSAADVVVDLVRADGSPASPLSGSPASPLPATIAPGATVSGVYAFTLATDARADVSITVSYRTGVPVAAFTGSVAS
jgi:hypothetical protein